MSKAKTLATTVSTGGVLDNPSAIPAANISGAVGSATNLAGGSNGTIPYQSASGTTQMLAVGTAGQVLQTNGVGAPSWATPASATTATNIAGGSNGTIPYQSAAGTTQMLAVGSVGQVLTSNGAAAPTWTSPSSGGFTAKTANYTAVSGDNILANTSAGSWTLTLPATPTTGSAVQVMDSIGTFGVYPLTVARNGSTIMSTAENMTLSVNGAATTFVYNGSTWRVI